MSGYATDERDMHWHQAEDGSPCACIEEEHDAAPQMAERNEAAEKLRRWFQNPDTRAILDEALAAERRATVERIAQKWDSRRSTASDSSGRWNALVRAILDEEAAR